MRSFCHEINSTHSKTCLYTTPSGWWEYRVICYSFGTVDIDPFVWKPQVLEWLCSIKDFDQAAGHVSASERSTSRMCEYFGWTALKCFQCRLMSLSLYVGGLLTTARVDCCCCFMKTTYCMPEDVVRASSWVVPPVRICRLHMLQSGQQQVHLSCLYL